MKYFQARWFKTLGLASLIVGAAACSKTEETVGGMNSADIVDEIGQATALVCPGSTGCSKADGALYVGAAAVAITPAIETWDDTNDNGKCDGNEVWEDLNGNGQWDPVWVAGFSAGRAATGVHDDVWARVITFEQGDVSYAIVSYDLVGFFHPDVVQLRLDAKAAGLDFDHIMVSSTHQHEGPDTMGLWGATNFETGYDANYIKFILGKTVDALKQAKDGQKKATMKVARTEAAEYIADTREPIVVEQSLYGINFLAEDQSVISTLVNWGNHPEALGARNTLITSDFPHYTREKLEAHYPGSTTVYVSGNMGGLMTTIGLNICPDEEGNDTCKQGTYERAQVVGEGVANKVIAALDGAEAQTFSDLSIGFRRMPFFVKTTNPKFALALIVGLLTRRVYDTETNELIEGLDLQQLGYDDILDGEIKLDTEVNVLNIGPVDMLTVPGELYPELWLEQDNGMSLAERPEGGDFPDAPTEVSLMSTLRDDSFKLIANQGNDSIGYIIPKAQYDVVRPRAYYEDGQYGEDNSVGEDAAPWVLDGVYKMFELGLDL